VRASSIAYRAADILGEKGHCKYLLEDPEGRLCLWGALWTAATGKCDPFGVDIDDPVRWTLSEIGRQIGNLLFEQNAGDPFTEYGKRSVEWNDNPATTMEDVVLILKKAGKEMENDAIADRV
jgi:hypothetical protein